MLLGGSQPLRIYSDLREENPVHILLEEGTLNITTQFGAFLRNLDPDQVRDRLIGPTSEAFITAALSHQLAEITGEMAIQLERAKEEAIDNKRANLALTQAVFALVGLFGLGAGIVAQAPEVAIGTMGIEVLAQAWLQNIKGISSKEAGNQALEEILKNSVLWKEIAILEQLLGEVNPSLNPHITNIPNRDDSDLDRMKRRLGENNPAASEHTNSQALLAKSSEMTLRKK